MTPFGVSFNVSLAGVSSSAVRCFFESAPGVSLNIVWCFFQRVQSDTAQRSKKHRTPLKDTPRLGEYGFFPRGKGVVMGGGERRGSGACVWCGGGGAVSGVWVGLRGRRQSRRRHIDYEWGGDKDPSVTVRLERRFGREECRETYKIIHDAVVPQTAVASGVLTLPPSQGT